VARRLRLVLALGILALAGCGAEAPRARTAPARMPDAGVGAGDAASDTSAESRLPRVDEIAATAISSAPGMREAARVEATAPLEREIARAGERDVCARVAFVASAPVDVALVDDARAVLAEHHDAARGILGTACVARGGAVVLRVARGADAGAAATTVRAVAWISP
jgi:hypothetical protein